MCNNCVSEEQCSCLKVASENASSQKGLDNIREILQRIRSLRMDIQSKAP